MKKALAIGCGVIVVIVVLLVGLAFWQGPKLIAKGKGFVKDAMEKEARISSMENAWQAPSSTPDAAWFPSEVEGWKLESSAPFTAAPEWDLSRPGRRASYRSTTGSMEVLVVAANDLEKKPLIERIVATLGSKPGFSSESNGVKVNVSSGSTSMTTTWGNRTTVKRNGERAQFWWIKDWLFIFLPQGEFEPETFSDPFIGGQLPATPEVEQKSPPADNPPAESQPVEKPVGAIEKAASAIQEKP